MVLAGPITTSNFCTPCTPYAITLNVNECASNSYVSPSGLYTWTTDGTYNDTLITDLGCDSIITVNLTFNNLQQSVVYNPASVNFCETGSAQFEVASSQTDVVYELINMKDSSSISVLNGGGALIYNTGIISETSTYGLRVSKNGCDLILSDYFVATVSEYPNNNVIIDRTTLASYEIDGQYKWLDCNNANAAIAGETSLEFIPATAGNYALEVTNAAGCVDTSNCINFTPPVPASALNFDGSNDNITIEGVDISNQSFTIESWVKNERPNTDNIICGQGPAGGSTGLHIGFRSNNVFTMDFYANGLNTPDTYTDADWHHWACVYDAKATGTNRFIYRDGILVASDVANSDFLGNGTFYIGQHSWGANFKGSLDEFHVWKRALTQEQIMNRLYCSTSDDLTALILNYNFNQGDSAGVNTFESTLLNSASSSMHGTLNNFALNGATSNWVAPGAISNNASCSNCVTQQVTINASSCGEAYVSPSGNYTWTTSGTYTDTVFTAYSCDSIITINFTNNSIDTAITRNGNMILSSQPNAAYTWLDCANAYAVIGGESAQSYSPAAAGSYAVAITRGTCVDTSNCFAYTPLPAFVEQFCIPTLGNNDMYRTIISNDYNGDGFVDMMARDDWGITRYFTNDGTGNFTGPVDLFPSNTAYVLYNHDLDSDGDVDVIGVNGTTQGHIYINDGAGNFTELSGVDLMNGTGIITAMDFGDVNGDGMIDIVTGNNNFSLSTDMNEVWLNTGSVGSPNFAYYSGVQNVNGGRNSVDLGDIDGDGDLDMATGSVSWRGYIYLNDGSGNFTQHVEYSEYSGAARFADWDNDGDLDRVNYDVYNNYGLRVSFNDGLGNMSYPPTHIMSMSTANNCVLSDFNSDGLLDLVFDHWGGNADVYLNTGCGFVKETSAPMSNASHGVHVNDFNNDGRPDVLCAGREISSCFQMNNMPTATAVPMSTIASVETDSSCGSSALVLAASATNGGGVNWYDASTGGNYLGNGNNYITPTLGNTATYYVEAVNAVGCKSARVPVVASVYNNPTVTISGAPVSIVCPGESVTLAASGADTYVWNPSTVSDNIPFTVYETDSYQVTGTDMHGCSNTASVTVNVASTSSNNVMATICEGQTFAVGADNYDTEGVYNITLVNASGCDSLVILNLSVNSINNVSVTAAICQGDDYTVGTSTYNSTGMHITTLTNMYGCDSTVTLDLTVNDLPIVSFAFATDTVCKDGGIIVLSGTPALGTFSGTSVTGTDFDPSTFGASTLVTVTYSHTDGNGCAASASDDIFVDICSGIAKMKSVAVSIRPNPTVGVVEINSTLPGEQPIKVLNGLGQTIFVSKMTTIKQIDFSNLSNGVYTVKVGDGSNAEYIKVVKE